MAITRMRFPSGRLVLGLLALSFVLGAVMIFGTMAHLSGVAEGASPFDMRPLGYSIGEARTLLTMLGDAGRAYYAEVQLAFDTVFPAIYALSRGLAIWWLTMPKRLRDAPIPAAVRGLLLIPAIAAAGFDYWENALIREMLVIGPTVTDKVVSAASMATQLKWAFGIVAELTMIGLAVVAFVRWRRRQA